MGALAFGLFALGCAEETDKVPPAGYTPPKTEGEEIFDFSSNAFSADVTLDGALNDARWAQEDVVTLGSWDDEDVTSGEYGAVVGSASDYANSKRMITKMFRGNVGFHFGFEVQDSDLAYLTLEDGDPAIWTDNILINLCTSIDGATIPMSDDYYFIVTAFGNTCFRRGANAAGMWGAWSGVLDYEASIHYAEDGETVTGFGVELVVPYTQIGLTKDSPLGFTLRSCDRVSASNVMIEREWWYEGDVHHFNTPNGYVIWGADNQLYSYYDYQMPAVTVQGTAVDYITGQALSGVTLTDGTVSVVTGENGGFTLENVNANADLVLSATGDGILSGQTYSVSRDKMRVLNGGTLSVTPQFLTTQNLITQTVSGVITSVGNVAGATVQVGDVQTTVAADGSYSLECTFNAPVLKMSVTAAGSQAAYETEISVQEAAKGKVERNIQLPVMSKLTQKFGANGDIETYLGWTAEGLFVRFVGTAPSNGYGIAFSANGGTSGQVILYHDFGTMCVTDFVSQAWNYALPDTYGIDANQLVDSQGRKIYTFVVPFENLGLTAAADIKIAPFEYTAAGPFAWYEDEYDKQYPFGSLMALKSYPVLKASGEVEFPVPETVLSTYEVGEFGSTNATAKFEKIEGAADGIRVTISYTPATNFWGFGVMLSDGTAGITQLYVPGYGTIDHRAYGVWDWLGNYVAAGTLGVQASEKTEGGKTIITLFYSYETLQSTSYGLNIDENTAQISINLFEYVNAGGSQYGVYNGMKDKDGAEIAVDCGVANFEKWNVAGAGVLSTYEVGTFGKTNATAKLEKVDEDVDGIRVTFTYTADADLFGFGVMLSDGTNAFRQLYAVGFGTVDHGVYGNWTWGNYVSPSVVGVVAAEGTAGDKKTVTLFYSYATLQEYGLTITENTDDIGINLFEYVNVGGSQYGCYNGMKNEGGTEILVDCGVAGFPVWSTATDPVISTYEVGTFGKTNATAKLEKVDEDVDGIRVTFTYTQTSGLFGFGIMLSDGTNAFRQLYAVGFGTVDHGVYGNWTWGNYVSPSAVGVVAAEGTDGDQKTVTLFYSYATLQEYGLTVTAQSAVGVNLFEYVDDGTGSQFGCYNGIKNEGGTEIAVDCGVSGFLVWDTENA